MKKLITLATVALFATSAFAQKGLVELNGCFDGTCDTLDFDMSSDTADYDDDADADEKSQNLALNYNYLFTNNFGAGLLYNTMSKTVDGDVKAADLESNYTKIGLNFFWNFDGGWESAYAALRYNMTTVKESDDVGDDDAKGTEIVLEYGKRMQMGKVFGLSLLYSPSVSYSMNTIAPGEGDDRKMTSLTLNPVNFSVAF